MYRFKDSPWNPGEFFGSLIVGVYYLATIQASAIAVCGLNRTHCKRLHSCGCEVGSTRLGHQMASRAIEADTVLVVMVGILSPFR